ncbi:FKBP-type peptidyl-prolyl cis-trans isomerase [Microbacterium sp. ZW T5_56]|uniref:FKBP-type peptidyl-prolyl cis-trans isomerase n=1 Tax=Microbacterium sp. ZW T5_56 TaxID=3378081 RepID=UPI003853CD07
MRKISAVIPVIALTAIALVGCAPAAGTANSAGCTPYSQPGPITSAVTVSGGFGEAPKLEGPSAMNVTAVERDVLIAGDGPQIVSQNQVIDLTYMLMRSSDGMNGEPTKQGLGTVGTFGQQAPTLGEQLMCAHEGDRLLLSLPAELLGTGSGMTASEGLVVAVDITRVYPDRASGTDVFNGTWGLPSVVRAPDGRSGVVVPDSAAPSTTAVETLIRGDGAELTADDAALLNVLGVSWTGKTQFRSSIDDGGPTVSASGDLPKAVADALVGATVGSQLMVVVPADEAASDAADTKAPKDTALIYVVDVLGTLPSS